MAWRALLAEVGDAGRLQVLFAAVVALMECVTAWSMLQTAILGATPAWWCVEPSTYSADNMTLNNTNFQLCAPTPAIGTPPVCLRYYEPSVSSIVSEWDLVCDRKYIKATVNSIQMGGVLIGCLLGGQMSDSWGRRVTCYLTMVTHAVTCLVAGFSSGWQMYAAIRFMTGAAMGSYFVLHYAYVTEFVRQSWRPVLASMPCWATGAGLMCLTAWRVPNWRHLHFICAAATLPLLLGWFISPESIRWLAAKGRIKEADKVLQDIAKINNRTFSTDTSARLSLLAEEVRTSGNMQMKYNYQSLFLGMRNTITTCILAFAWMSLSMTFYGIIFGVSALSGNIYLNVFLLSVVEVPLIITTSCLTNCFRRPWTSSICFFLTSLAAFGILIADRTAAEEVKGRIVQGLAICSKLFVAVAWTSTQTLCVELYPSVIRSLGLGAANVAARIGGILAPFILGMETSDDVVRCYTIVGSIMAVSGLAVLLLAETKGKALQDTLHQLQDADPLESSPKSPC